MRLLLSLLFIIILFSSCDTENVLVDKISNPKITNFSSDIVTIGDTLEIIGSSFINGDFKKTITIEPNIRINSSDCIIWQTNRIIFVVPDSARSGNLQIRIGDSISNQKYIKILQIAKFDSVEIPSGTFKMGSDNGFPNEMPVHDVAITKAFWITKTEITQRLFNSVMKYNPSTIKNLVLPVDSISWLESIKFCNKLSLMQGLDSCYTFSSGDVIWASNNNGWRLPTEAEWEYAARANTTSDYGGTNYIDAMGWYNENSGMKAHPVASKTANAFGLYDMHGNVWEWIWDWYKPDYYKFSTLSDPTGPVSGTQKILRGGSWGDGKNYARSANRSTSSVLANKIGFRIVRNK